MKLGFIIHPDLRGLSLSELAAWAVENGFQAVDVREVNDEVVRTCQEYSLEIGALHAPSAVFDPDPHRRAAGVQAVKDAVSAAADHGVRTVMTLLRPMDPAKTTAENFATWVRVYPEAVARAEDRGVRLAVENCPFVGQNLAYSPEIWEAMFNAIPSKALGLCFDPSHLVWLGIDYLRALWEFRSRLYHVHAKDCEILPEGLYRHGVLDKVFNKKNDWDVGWWRYRLPGLGEVDWTKFLSALAEIGYDGVVSIEHEDPVWEGDLERTKKGLILGRRHLAQWIL
jgi:sugar phosphate isomerase/epimerase